MPSRFLPRPSAAVVAALLLGAAGAWAAGLAGWRGLPAREPEEVLVPTCGLAWLSPPEELPFARESDVAMGRMMAAMIIRPTGDVDADFAAMMIPHHQGAIDMAQAELRYGRNEQLRRLAQEIIVEQQQEIAAMRLALGQTLPPSDPAPDQIAPSAGSAADPSMPSMTMSMEH